MTEPTKFGIGGVWDDSEWRVEYDHNNDGSDTERCPHAVSLDPLPSNLTKDRWSVSRVVVATNEGGYDSTGVCLDCILDASVSLFNATDWLVEFVEKLLDDWEGDQREMDEDRGAWRGTDLEALIAARRAEWKALKEDRPPVSRTPETEPETPPLTP